MSQMSIRGIAVVSATAVTAVGSAVGVASSATAQNHEDIPAPARANFLSDIPEGHQADAQTAALSQQAQVQTIAADEALKKKAEETVRKRAAEEAIAKKAAAEAQEKAQRERVEMTATRSSTRPPVSSATQRSYSVAEIQTMARQMVTGDQYQCMSRIVDHESSWNYQAVNPSSGAYGLFQALPGSKMSSAGSDWRTNPQTQIKWGLNYMTERYGSACSAWEFWQANRWY